MKKKDVKQKNVVSIGKTVAIDKSVKTIYNQLNSLNSLRSLKILYDMKEIAELGYEGEHLDWLQKMGFWESCFLLEMHYIDEERIGYKTQCYDDYWDDMHEWFEGLDNIRRITKRHKFRKKYAII